MKRIIGYMRVSTEAQTEKYGLDVQRTEILKEAKKRGDTIHEWYVDGGFSGSKLERPEIQRLLADAESGIIEKVYLYKLDRMSRDVIDALTLLYRTLPSYGVQVISATEELSVATPMDRVVIGVNALLGQYEREVIRMRMSAGMIERVKSGKYPGGASVPLGYRYDRNDGILHPNELSSKIKKVFQMYLEGYYGSTISHILGFKSSTTVYNILRQVVYTGNIPYKGNLYKGLHEPLVSEADFAIIQNMLKARSISNYGNIKHTLTGLIYCGVCGKKMRYVTWGSRKKNGKKPHKLACYTRFAATYHVDKGLARYDASCDNVVDSEAVEAAVEDSVRRFSIGNSDVPQKQVSFEAEINDEIKNLNSKISRMYDVYIETGSDVVLSKIKDKEARKKKLEEELAFLAKDDAVRREKIDKFRSVADIYDTLDTRQKNLFLKEVIEKIVIVKDDIKIYYSI